MYSDWKDQAQARRSSAARPLLIGLIVAVLVGGSMMYVAWAHNPQCEIRCDEEIYRVHWIMIGASWAMPSFLAASLLAFLIGASKRRK